MATEYTPNYNLDLYAGTDKPNLRDQYNAAMGKIDTELKNQHDDNVSTNNNIGTLQTQMRNAENDIDTLQTQQGQTSTALEQLTETVDGFESQIAGKAPMNHASSATTYGTASLTQYGHVKLSDTASQDGSETATAVTPVAVSNAVAEAVDELNGSIESLQDSTAPKNHAAAGNTYGLGSETMYGHVKLSDAVGVQDETQGCAATPKGVDTAINQFATTLKPKIYTFGTPGVNQVSGSLCVDEAIQLCTLRLSVNQIRPTGGGTAQFVTGFTVPEQYLPTNDINAILDVNYNNGSIGSVTQWGLNGSNRTAGKGSIFYRQYSNSATQVTADGILCWFYGAQPATL